MILNVGAGKARDKVPPLFSVTGGTYSYAQSVAADGKVNWEIALLSGSNATLNFQRVVDAVDVFLVGGGKSAGTGNGANGGQRLTATGVSVSSGTNYAFTVGGSNGSTSIFGRTANSGSGSSGGIGGTNASGGATRGGDGAYAFGASSSLIFSGRKYGPGGGGGGVNRRVGGYFAGAAGGETGGGSGSSQTSAAGGNGTANTGAGGGGGFYDEYTYTASAGGAGGSGIIIIRNAR